MRAEDGPPGAADGAAPGDAAGDAAPEAGTGGDGPGAAGLELAEDRAAHLTEAFDWMVRRCRDAVSGDRGLHHVAHYSAGVYDFAVDVLDSPALAGAYRSAGVDRRHYGDIGRRLSFKMSSMEHALDEVRTGRLVRTVLHTQSGVVYCNSVIPGGYVVALTLGGFAAPGVPLSRVDTVRDADRAASELATALRRDLRLGSFDPGGWRHERSGDWLTAPPAGDARTAPPSPPPAGGAAPFQQGEGEDATVARCRAALDPAELVYVSYHHDDAGIFSLDLFDHEAVSRFFTHITVDARRKFYAQFGRQFAFLVRQLAQLVRPLFEGRILRVVLDVEQGAIYYYRLDSGSYVVGATLNQDRVSHADDKMAALAIDLRRESGTS